MSRIFAAACALALLGPAAFAQNTMGSTSGNSNTMGNTAGNSNRMGNTAGSSNNMGNAAGVGMSNGVSSGSPGTMSNGSVVPPDNMKPSDNMAKPGKGNGTSNNMGPGGNAMGNSTSTP